MKIAELEAREDVRLPITIHWNKAGKSRDDRHRRQLDPPRRARVEQVDQPRLQHQPARARPRHGAALSDRRRPGAAALHLAGQLAARQPAGADVVAGVASRPTSTSGSDRTARSAGPRRPGRSTKIASTRRRSWTTSIARSTTARRSSCSGIDTKQWDLLVGVIESTDRVAAHDVAADRSDASDVRQGARGEVRRLDRARLPQVRRVRRRGHGARRRRRRRS